MARNRSSTFGVGDYVRVEYENVVLISKQAVCLTIEGEDFWVPKACFLDEPPDIDEISGECHIEVSLAEKKGIPGLDEI